MPPILLRKLGKCTLEIHILLVEGKLLALIIVEYLSKQHALLYFHVKNM